MGYEEIAELAAAGGSGSSHLSVAMRRLAFLFLRLTGIPFLLRELHQRKRVTILCWHDPDPDTFSKHIRCLQRNYTILPLRRYVDWRVGRSAEPLPRKALVITLDDGHKCNFALKKVVEVTKVPVTIFLCSAIVGTNRHYWWTAPVNDVEGLKRLPDAERLTRLATAGFDEQREYDSRQALSDEEIHVLKSMVDLQAHTRLHPILPNCTQDRALDEIAGAKKELEEKYALNVYAIAYPNGDYSARDVEVVRRAGYECAVTLSGRANTDDTDLLRLERIPVYDKADCNELIVKASGLWETLVRPFSRERVRRSNSVPA